MKNFYKKKSLGQNFLKNVGVLKKIVGAGKIITDDTVLEIGPGEGNLTEELLSRGAKVIAVEKDDRLIPILQEKFSEQIANNRLVLIKSDILDISPFTFSLTANKYKLIANIPYYITGEILRLALEKWPHPSLIVFLVQKEVAERIIARNKKESLLSMSVKVYGDPKIVGVVKAGSFVPSPKVDSAILSIENISKEHLKNIDEKRFFEILKSGFAHKRKKLVSNLKISFQKPNLSQHAGWTKRLTTCNITPSARAEDLSLEDWLCLAAN